MSSRELNNSQERPPQTDSFNSVTERWRNLLPELREPDGITSGKASNFEANELAEYSFLSLTGELRNSAASKFDKQRAEAEKLPNFKERAEAIKKLELSLNGQIDTERSLFLRGTQGADFPQLVREAEKTAFDANDLARRIENIRIMSLGDLWRRLQEKNGEYNGALGRYLALEAYDANKPNGLFGSSTAKEQFEGLKRNWSELGKIMNRANGFRPFSEREPIRSFYRELGVEYLNGRFVVSEAEDETLAEALNNEIRLGKELRLKRDQRTAREQQEKDGKIEKKRRQTEQAKNDLKAAESALERLSSLIRNVRSEVTVLAIKVKGLEQASYRDQMTIEELSSKLKETSRWRFQARREFEREISEFRKKHEDKKLMTTPLAKELIEKEEHLAKLNTKMKAIEAEIVEAKRLSAGS